MNYKRKSKENESSIGVGLLKEREMMNNKYKKRRRK